jgi:hypothetical protein
VVYCIRFHILPTQQLFHKLYLFLPYVFRPYMAIISSQEHKV